MPSNHHKLRELATKATQGEWLFTLNEVHTKRDFIATCSEKADELEAIAREHMAEWFEETKGVVGDETV